MLGGNDRTVSVSVIVPCYNCESTIRRAVNSVAQQAWLPKDIILVNDASTDGTLEVIKSIQRKYSCWIKVVSLNVNSGPSAARNEGYNHAKSDYIAFLDADDSWHSQKLQIQYFWMKAHPEVLLTGHRMVSYEKKSNKSIKVNDLVVSEISKTNILISNPFSTPTVMIHSKVPVRFDLNQYYAEDYLVWLTIFFDFGKVYRIEHEMAYMYKSAFGEGGLSQNLVAMEKGVLEVYSKIYKKKCINLFQYCCLMVFSITKFFRRVFLVWIGKSSRWLSWK